MMRQKLNDNKKISQKINPLKSYDFKNHKDSMSPYRVNYTLHKNFLSVSTLTDQGKTSPKHFADICMKRYICMGPVASPRVLHEALTLLLGFSP